MKIKYGDDELMNVGLIHRNVCARRQSLHLDHLQNKLGFGIGTHKSNPSLLMLAAKMIKMTKMVVLRITTYKQPW